MRQRVDGGGEGNAEDDEEDVGNGQVQDQHVGRVAHLKFEESRTLLLSSFGGNHHLSVERDHQYDQEVPEEPYENDEGEEDGDHDGDHLLQAGHRGSQLCL